MHLTLGDLCAYLDGDPPLLAGWRDLFAGWPNFLPDRAAPPADLRLHLRLADALPPLPAAPPGFVQDDDNFRPGDAGALAVYEDEDNFVLSFHDVALVRVSPNGAATGQVTEMALRHGRLEDVTFTSLAPLLRRHGYYLVHAFAAERNGRALLLVGRSGSGKTTTGLRLVTGGWALLANDVVLLQARPDGVYVLPTPGAISVTVQTLDLLPGLAARSTERGRNGKFRLPPARLPDLVWGTAVPVTAVCFPTVTGGARSRFAAQPRAVTMARLMAESVDRWDRAALPGHLSLLQRLSRQATCRQLELGRDIARLPELFEQMLEVENAANG